MANVTYQKDILKDKVAVVTGGTSNGGLGTATAFHLAELGAKVYTLGLKADETTIPNVLDVEAIEMDVTDEEKIEKFFSDLTQLDILFNGAGVNMPDQYKYDTYKKVMDINANSAFHISNLARPLLAKSDIASIINVSSMYAIFGSDMAPAYSASKGAIGQITKSLAIEYADEGIRVNAVAPGWIDTPLMDSLPEGQAETIIERTPMKRLGKPEEVGQAVAFFCTPAASFVTGAILPIDGAYSLF
nr:SDR family oxidoreductase [Oceanobacillus manasiensis]